MTWLPSFLSLEESICGYPDEEFSNGADNINDSKHNFIGPVFFMFYQAFSAKSCDLELSSLLYGEMFYEERPTSTFSTTS